MLKHTSSLGSGQVAGMVNGVGHPNPLLAREQRMEKADGDVHGLQNGEP